MKTIFSIILTSFILIQGYCQSNAVWQTIVDKQDSLYNCNTDQKLDFFYSFVDPLVDSTFVEVSNRPLSNNKYRVIISANGDKSKFKSIKELVAKAPTMDKFEIVALRPAEPTYAGMGGTDDLNLMVKYMYFEPLLLNGELGMGFYLYKPKVDIEYSVIHDNGCMVIDHLIGEEFFAEHIHFWDFYFAEDATKENSLYPLSKLKEFVEFHIQQQ